MSEKLYPNISTNYLFEELNARNDIHFSHVLTYINSSGDYIDVCKIGQFSELCKKLLEDTTLYTLHYASVKENRILMKFYVGHTEMGCYRPNERFVFNSIAMIIDTIDECHEYGIFGFYTENLPVISDFNGPDVECREDTTRFEELVNLVGYENAKTLSEHDALDAADNVNEIAKVIRFQVDDYLYKIRYQTGSSMPYVRMNEKEKMLCQEVFEKYNLNEDFGTDERHNKTKKYGEVFSIKFYKNIDDDLNITYRIRVYTGNSDSYYVDTSLENLIKIVYEKYPS